VSSESEPLKKKNVTRENIKKTKTEPL
jgi:hypothetical protein